MIDIDAWIDRYMQALRATFGERIRFLGLQGSYGRGEASADSDIDMVVILDEVTPEDIATYDAVLDALEHREMACGFLSGLEELRHWDPSDLFQFCHDTAPIMGSLKEILANVGPDDVDRAILRGACDIYHGCVHNRLYEKDEGILRGLYKTATFVIRASVYRQTGEYCKRLDALVNRANGMDGEIVSGYMGMKNGGGVDFQELSDRLFHWAKAQIVTHY